ncbi:hypothetical protein I858_011185 [Planococcus versutus]|uniref:Uncharacterized protein n=1 Tax=Planococcus versutus TaxID=1302659 RepID=A0A1B1S2Z0_9BACL|nr:polysaccharide biosynthesis C-terminal domain-containing protein [Planococcus versutus]ANU27551.1 hypothetical protein I858_011185 [Planococcus versutus]
MIKKLADLWNKGAFHIIIGSFVTKFVSFFGTIFLIRVMSKESYGLLSYMENIYGYLFIFAGMGLGNGLLRYVILGKNIHEKFTYYLYTVKAASIYNFFYVAIIILVLTIYPHPAEFESIRIMLIIMVIFTLPFEYLFIENTLNFRAMFDNKLYAGVGLTFSILLIIFQYAGAVLFDLEGVVFLKITANIIMGLGVCYFSYNYYFKGIKKTKLEKKEKKEINIYSIQYMFTSGAWSIFMLNDIMLLGILSGSALLVADFKVAYVLPANLAIISTAIGIFIGPYFIKHENDKTWVWKNYKKVLFIVFSLIAPIALFLFIFAPQIVSGLYGSEYISTVPIMRILIFSSLINATFRFTTAHLLSSMGQIKYNLYISIVGILLQVSINIFAIPTFGISGLAITSVFVNVFMACSLFYIFRIKYK